MPTYNLVDEAWVPCLAPDGRRIELGLRELFLTAHELQELRDESPLVTASLYRLLIVIAHRIVDGPRDEDHWEELWNAGRFDSAAVNAYFDKWRHRFDLFDDKWPFLQVAGFSIIDGKSGTEQTPASIINIEHERNNITLFDHGNGAEYAGMPAAQAAGHLLAFQFFAMSGGKGATSNLYGEHPYLANGTAVGEIMALLKKDNLCRTILLNALCRDAPWPVKSGNEDAPLWEQDSMQSVAPCAPKGYFDMLTFPARAMRLLYTDRDGQASITGAYIAQGSSLQREEGVFYRSPFSPYSLHKDYGLLPIGFSPQRSLWRDSYTLFISFLDEEKKADPRPLTFKQLAGMSINGNDEYSCIALGMAKKSGKAIILMWHHEELPVPTRLLKDTNSAAWLQKGLQKCEEAGFILGGALRKLALYAVSGHSDKNPQEAEKKNAATLAERSTFWARMELPFKDFLRSLGKDDPETAYLAWCEKCRKEALNAFHESAVMLVGNVARDLKEIVTAESDLKYKLRKFMDKKEVSSD